jgi:hypothetical protein
MPDDMAAAAAVMAPQTLVRTGEQQSPSFLVLPCLTGGLEGA